MNSVTRTIAKMAFSQQSQPASRGWYALRYFATSSSSKRSAKLKGTADSNPSGQKEWPRPSEIPYQTKVANSVSLSGYVHMPVQFEAASDGKFWAGTVVSLKPSDSPPLWIPIIFEGDLAHIAACHLKENDHIYIDGQLTADLPSSNETRPPANVQVMVRNVNFVDGSLPQTMKSIESHKKEGPKTHSASTKKASETALGPWRDLLDNPEKWKDFREKKRSGLVKPKHPDFKRIDDGHALWLDSASNSVLSELEELKFNVPFQTSKQVNQRKGDESWNDLVENPNKWWDNRLDKLNGKANKKYPDFKNKETGEALWLSSSPVWVESKLPSLNSTKSPDVSKRGSL